MPREIGPVDIATFGSILLHLRDPFAALERSASLVRERIVVTDMMPVPRRLSRAGLAQPLRRVRPGIVDRILPDLEFVADPVTRTPVDTWWRISPRMIGRWLAVLGFPNQTTTYHDQVYRHPNPQAVPMFTVVAER